MADTAVEIATTSGIAEPRAMRAGDYDHRHHALQGKVQFRTDMDNYLNKVINLVQEAQKTKSETQRLADKAAACVYVTKVIVGLQPAPFLCMVVNRPLNL